MAVREGKVEKYLKKCVEQEGGVSRKWVSPGVSGVPDQIVIIQGKVIMVEVKPHDGRLSSIQVREHERLWGAGADVTTVYGEIGVECLIYDVKHNHTIKREYR